MAADDIARRFRVEVVSRGSFSQDWLPEYVAAWEPILTRLDDRPSRMLEVGSFEGLSACYLLWRLPAAELTCIDTFEGSAEHEGMDLTRLERVFSENVALVDQRRVRKIVADSRMALPALVQQDESFDFVYIDGSHAGLDVLVDAALGWQLVVDGGYLVFDDYRWSSLGEDPLVRPGPAIDAFLTLVVGKFDLVLEGRQLGVRKTIGTPGVATT